MKRDINISLYGAWNKQDAHAFHKDLTEFFEFEDVPPVTEGDGLVFESIELEDGEFDKLIAFCGARQVEIAYWRTYTHDETQDQVTICFLTRCSTTMREQMIFDDQEIMKNDDWPDTPSFVLEEAQP